MSRVTYAHQDALPSLPVPPLEQTLRKYLLTVRPLLSDAEYARTVALVRDFEQDDGPRLHRMLEERARNKRNWIAECETGHRFVRFTHTAATCTSPGELQIPCICSNVNYDLLLSAIFVSILVLLFSLQFSP
jgi:hypothetical protein